MALRETQPSSTPASREDSFLPESEKEIREEAARLLQELVKVAE